MIKKFSAFFKKEPVLIIAAICAVVSMFFVPPSGDYAGYIDWKVLALLFCLMAVVAGAQGCGAFDVLGQTMLKCSSMRMLRLVLVLMPFVTSMVITNDVALITFVPFAILVLSMMDKTSEIIPTVVLQTVAANLGSMATPVGNPQSLFLYNHFGLSAGKFFATMLPFVGISLVLLVLCCICQKNELIKVELKEKKQLNNPKKLIIYGVLFVLCLLCVLHVLDYRIVLAVTLLALAFFDRGVFKKVDYFLLVTFVCFFVFSGNLGNLAPVKNLLTGLLGKSTLLTGFFASQIISNVPAAVLLAGFTEDARGLLLGTNLGGLGTIIASLASLISFKYYIRCENAKTGRYFVMFTVANVAFAVVLLGTALILG